MLELGEAESREIRARLLERQHPQVKASLFEGEVLRAVSKRKPHYISGSFCIAIGVLFAWQSLVYLYPADPKAAILAFFLCALVIWLGVWLAVWIKEEYVFVTDGRIAHCRMGLLGRLEKCPRSIPLAEIKGIHLYQPMRRIETTRTLAGFGDVLIKKTTGNYLIPTLQDGMVLAEILIAELQRYRS